MKNGHWSSGNTIAVLCLGAVLGACWTAEATIITGESATTTADDQISTEVHPNTVNNSGITINLPDLATDGAITHSANVNGHSWAGDEFVGTVLGVTLTIDLGQAYNIDGYRIWNYNGFAGTDVGLQLYDLETSSDGLSWTLQQNNQFLAKAPNVADVPSDNTYDGVYFPGFFAGTRYVRLTIVDTYRGSDDLGGISEIMFNAIPEPSTILLLSLGGGLVWSRRRKLT